MRPDPFLYFFFFFFITYLRVYLFIYLVINFPSQGTRGTSGDIRLGWGHLYLHRGRGGLSPGVSGLTGGGGMGGG